jgi:hypothetical protein
VKHEQSFESKVVNDMRVPNLFRNDVKLKHSSTSKVVKDVRLSNSFVHNVKH